MNRDKTESIFINNEDEMDNIVDKIISEKNYSGCKVGPLYTKFENDKIVNGYDVYFYDNDGNVIDKVTFKFRQND